MSPLKTPVSSGKRRRAANKAGRRFTVKKDSSQKKSLPSPATLPKRAKKANSVVRFMAIGALFFVLLSTISSWRSRAVRRKLQSEGAIPTLSQKQRPFRSLFAFRLGRREKDPETASSASIGSAEEDGEAVPNGDSKGEPLEIENMSGKSASQAVSSSLGEGGQENSHTVTTEVEERQSEDITLSFEELPERIEWYSREDYKEGSRPMCRISKPFILSNGTILVPDWMAQYEKLLHRCGLGTHSFYSSNTGPEGLERLQDIEADFALTIHPERFQEPTHVASVYLTEHILKSSYLFDVFGGDARPGDGLKEHHCYTYENDSTCAQPRPVRSLLKPAIFVPKRIENGLKSAWSRRLVDMFGKAHGHGHDAIHLNASTILIKSHQGQAEGLVGTGFRSILTTDGMFRHLPPNSLQYSNFYSPKNGVEKSPKRKESEVGCKILVGIGAPADGEGGIKGIEDLKDKIEVLSRLAITGSSIQARIISFSPTNSLDEHIKEMQELDIYLAGSGDEMSSIGFLRWSSAAFELMPFGIKPTTHESLARALGLPYDTIRGKPSADGFKQCLDAEIFNLRKKGQLSYTESPEWEEPVLKAWNDAVGEFALSGSSSFDILKAEPPVNNYHARVCAQKQNIEVSVDEAARKVVLLAKEMCSSS